MKSLSFVVAAVFAILAIILLVAVAEATQSRNTLTAANDPVKIDSALAGTVLDVRLSSASIPTSGASSHEARARHRKAR